MKYYSEKYSLWVDVEGNVYQGDKKLKPFYNKKGRAYIAAGKVFSVHKIVVDAFFREIPEGWNVDHINEDPAKNCLSNLRLMPKEENWERSREKMVELQWTAKPVELRRWFIRMRFRSIGAAAFALNVDRQIVKQALDSGGRIRGWRCRGLT
jgi:hypothetical protein